MLRDSRARRLLPPARAARPSPVGGAGCLESPLPPERAAAERLGDACVPTGTRGIKRKGGGEAPTKHAPQTKPKWRKARGRAAPGPCRRLGLARVPGRSVMRTEQPTTPGPRLSLHLDAGRVAAPQPRSLAAAAVSQCAGAAGRLAPHGAAGLAEDRVLVLPVQVPGGARRAREGAAGQVGARPGPRAGLAVAAAGSAVPGIWVPVRAGEGAGWAPAKPLGPFLEICPLGRIFARKHKPPEARGTQVDARGKCRGKRGRGVCVGVPSGGFAATDCVFNRRILVKQATASFCFTQEKSWIPCIQCYYQRKTILSD